MPSSPLRPSWNSSWASFQTAGESSPRLSVNRVSSRAQRTAFRHPQRHVQHGTILGAVDVRTGERRVDLRSPTASVGQLHEQPHRLVGDAVLRVVEVPAGRVDVEVIGAARVGREQRAQVVISERGRVRIERGPFRKRAESGHQEANSRGWRS